MTQKVLFPGSIVLIFLFISTPFLVAQDCGDGSNVFSFEYDGRTYQVVKENRRWEDAAACAVLSGGKLVEINSANEQAAVFEGISNASINPESTIASDFDDIAFVWLGGNDLELEGDWMWDGDNDGGGGLFWVGSTTGAAVGGAYNNWGNDPDNNGDQDGLAMPLTDWPLGTAGQWADLKVNNDLYFVVEFATLLSTENQDANNLLIDISPNPSQGILTVKNHSPHRISNVKVYDMQGREMKVNTALTEGQLDISQLGTGLFIVKVQLENGVISVKRIVKSE